MPDVAPPPYPKGLTTASWDKAKGLIARISKVKTGVTEELQKARAAYDKAPWADLNLSKAYIAMKSPITLEALKKLQDDHLRTNQPKFKALENVFDDLARTLTKKAGEFEKDPKLKQFAPALKLMAQEANKFTYAVAWGTVSSENQRYLQDKIDNQAKADKQWAEAKTRLKSMIDDALKAVENAIKKPPTQSDYVAKLWSENLRGIGAQIAMAAKSDPALKDAFADPMKQVAKLWGQGGLPKSDKEIPERLKADLVLIRKFKQVAGG